MITRLQQPCSIVHRGFPRDPEETHYTPGEILTEITRLMTEDPGQIAVPIRLIGPCWVAKCVVCGMVLGSEEFADGHGEDLADIVLFAHWSGWLVAEGLECFCRSCRPDIKERHLHAVPVVTA